MNPPPPETRCRPAVGLLQGHWTRHDEMRIPIGDLGFRQGATAVERLRTYGGEVFRLDDHLDRWQRTVEVIGIEGLPLRDAIKVLIDELIGATATLCGPPVISGLPCSQLPAMGMAIERRLARALESHRSPKGSPATNAWPTRRVDQRLAQPSDCWPREIKVRCRLHYYLADRIARDEHTDAVGVLVDPDGVITDTSIANVAIVENGVIVTPPDDRVLGGITQRFVRRLAREASIDWRSDLIDGTRMEKADEVLLTGTDGGLWFASRVGRSPIAGGKPGKVYRELLDRFDIATVV